MKKKLLIGVLALVMCFTLVGCGKTESNNNNNSNNNQKENSTKAEKTVTSEAKTSASKYKKAIKIFLTDETKLNQITEIKIIQIK